MTYPELTEGEKLHALSVIWAMVAESCAAVTIMESFFR